MSLQPIMTHNLAQLFVTLAFLGGFVKMSKIRSESSRSKWLWTTCQGAGSSLGDV